LELPATSLIVPLLLAAMERLLAAILLSRAIGIAVAAL
jgi:hypothetical protein